VEYRGARQEMSRALDALIMLFVASLGLNWPALPGNAHLPDLLFGPLVLLSAAVLIRERQLRAVSWTRLDVWLLAYLAGALPSLAATDDMRASLAELLRHAYLVAIYATLAAVVVSGRQRAVGGGFRWSALVHAAFGLAATAIFAFGMPMPPDIGEVMRMPYVGDVLRLRALTFSPSMLGALLTATAPFVFVAAVANDAGAGRRWALAGVAVVAAMLLTFSHTLAGFLVAILFVAWPLLSVRRPLRLAAACAVVAVAIFFNLTLTASVRSLAYGGDSLNDATPYPYAVGGGQATIGPARVDYEVMSYFRIKQLALEAFAAHPLTGVGLDRFHRVSEAAYQSGRLPSGYREIDPHSALLGSLAETGLVGGITLVGFWWAAGATGFQLLGSARRHEWLARAALAAFIGLLVNGINVDIMNFRFFWAGLGLLRGLSQQANAS
jgi:hypothetical protein